MNSELLVRFAEDGNSSLFVYSPRYAAFMVHFLGLPTRVPSGMLCLTKYWKEISRFVIMAHSGVPEQTSMKNVRQG